MEESTHPTIQEYEFLKLAYIRFEEIWQIYIKEDFYDQPAEYRFFFLKDAFSIYSEVIKYKPLISYLSELEFNKEKLWLILNVDFPKIVRNIILHFQFGRWEDVYINKALVSWYNGNNSTIDKFFEKYKGYEPIICKTKSKMNTVNEFKINFPPRYDYLTNIYLKDIINEEAGVDLFLTLMKSAMFSQLKSLNYSPYNI